MFGNITGKYGRQNTVEPERRHPDNRDVKQPGKQVRVGFLLAKIGIKERVITFYRQTAGKFARKHQFSQAMALNKPVRRLAPSEESKDRHGNMSADMVNLASTSKTENSSKILISKNVPFLSCRLCQREKMME